MKVEGQQKEIVDHTTVIGAVGSEAETRIITSYDLSHILELSTVNILLAK